ncbi:MAG: hypothetical protein ACRDU8_00730 [Egibacteraceae bacterium]
MTQEQLTYLIIALVVLVVVIVVVAAVAASRRRREREALRARYGDEYDRTVKAAGGRRAAVRDLKERETLHQQLTLRDLNEADRDLVRRHMATLQYRFVEDPADVLLQMQRVATEVLRARGYPVAEDREKALRLFSVDHPKEAGHVRTVITGEHGGDVDRMREAFLGVRRALQEVAGISYVLGDAADSPADLHDPRAEGAEPPSPRHVAPAQEPAAQDPTAHEPAAQEPAAQEPAAQEPAAQEPAAQEPTLGGSTARESTADETPESGAPEPGPSEPAPPPPESTPPPDAPPPPRGAPPTGDTGPPSQTSRTRPPPG